MSFFNNKKYLLVILMFLLHSHNANSQGDVHLTPQNDKIKYDTTRIQDLSDQLSLWLYSIKKIYSLQISNTDTDQSLIISPNEQTNIGLGFNYKWMGIGFAFKPPWSKNDDDIYGKTSRFDFQLNIFTRSFGIDFSAQYYKGYYLKNPNDFLDWNKPEFPQLKDLETFSTELSAYYFFNHRKFSYRAAFVRNEIQKKGAGSIIAGTYIRFDLGASQGSFVPEDIPDSLNTTFMINSYLSGNYGLSFGYTYTFVIWKKFFINLSLVPGFGLKTMVVNTTEGSFKPKVGLSGRAVFRSALGYEHKYFYLGISSISITNSFSYENIDISAHTSKFRFFVGKRFDISKKKEGPKDEY